MIRTKVVVASALVMALCATAYAITDAETGQSFSDTQDIWSKSWVAIGVGAREKYTVNVYAAAFYVEKERGSTALSTWLSGAGSSYASGGKVDISKAKGDQKFYNV